MTAVLLVNYRTRATSPSPRSSFPWLGESSAIDIQLQPSALDGLSLWLFGLSSLLLFTSRAGELGGDRRPPGRRSMRCCCCLGSGMLGVFAARDIILFYIFFEFTLIPLFFLIGIWGSEDRRYAATKFFLFTLAGSVLTFLGLLAIVLWDYNHSATGVMTFSIPALTAGLAEHPIAAPYQLWIFLALFAGLCHQGAAVSAAHLAAAGPRAGADGRQRDPGRHPAEDRHLRLRPLQPADAARRHGRCACPGCLGLSVAGIIYGALVALAQTDMKRLIAYSSVSHLGFCMLGLFALNELGVEGGVLQMINHGLSTGGLFAVVGMIYERYHTREIANSAAWPRRMPRAGVLLSAVHALEHRPAGPERLRRRVPDPDRHVPAGLDRRAGSRWRWPTR